MPDPGRLAAHVLLDGVVAFDPGAESGGATDLALQRLMEVGAVSATMDDADHLDLDAEPLLGGTLVLLSFLVRQLSLYAEVDPLEVVAEARRFIDGESTIGLE
ncbi:MAG: hypothetical protein WKF93_10180 [Acidimicrobiales bacterium]